MKPKKVNIYGSPVNKYKVITPSNYYIVDMEDMIRPKLVAKYFNKKDQAIFCINKYFGGNFRRYDIVIGQDLLDDPIEWYTGLILGDYDRLNKYDYPEEKITQQEKKTWRTMYRYHERKKLNSRKNGKKK
jgi:hypothetical protein